MKNVSEVQPRVLCLTYLGFLGGLSINSITSGKLQLAIWNTFF